VSQNIAIIGECMLEVNRNVNSNALLNSRIQASIGYGGDTLNTAIYLARLGITVDYFTALGDDQLSSWMINEWKKEGVGCDFVLQTAAQVPGLYMISISDKGERSFSYWRDHAPAKYIFSDEKQRNDLFNQLMDYDNIYLSGITLAIYSQTVRDCLYEFFETYRATGKRICFDGNYRARLWEDNQTAQDNYRKMYSLTDIALPTADDEYELFQEPEELILKRMESLGVEELVLKKGEHGCILKNRSTPQAGQLIAAHELSQVVDTTAAGDSFNAGYLSARLKNENPITAALKGHKLASIVVQNYGAVIPSRMMPEL